MLTSLLSGSIDASRKTKATPLVEVNKAGTGKACRMTEYDTALEDIVIPGVVVDGGIRTWDAQEVAEFSKKKGVVCPLCSP